MTIQRIEEVGGQYCKTIFSNGIVQTAGLIAENWEGDIREQTAEILAQIDHLFAEAGTDKSKLLTMMVYIASMDDYADFKEVFADWVTPGSLPARATVRADLIDPKLKIEIIATAAL